MDTITHGLSGASLGILACTLIGDGSLSTAVITSTTIAALLPDFDFIFALINRPLLAWRLHRVVLHNIFIFPLLALVIAYLSGLISSEATDFWWLVGLNFTALLTHLFLDLITSFGTAVFYPLSNKRYAWGTHFLADPTISILLMLSLIPVLNVWMLMLLGGYFLLSLMLRLMAKYQAQVHQDQLALTHYPLYLRPRTFAPWQWLAVIVKDDEYVFFYLSPFGFQPSQTTPRGLETRAAHHAEKDDLLRCYISIADFPRYEDTQRDGQPAIVVEDIQWWWKLPYRPMAMSALIDNKGVPYQVKESKKISTSPTG